MVRIACQLKQYEEFVGVEGEPFRSFFPMYIHNVLLQQWQRNVSVS